VFFFFPQFCGGAVTEVASETSVELSIIEAESNPDPSPELLVQDPLGTARMGAEGLLTAAIACGSCGDTPCKASGSVGRFQRHLLDKIKSAKIDTILNMYPHCHVRFCHWHQNLTTKIESLSF
jgi:hypothetical protein